MLRVHEEKLNGEKQAMKREIEEGALIIGRDIYSYGQEKIETIFLVKSKKKIAENRKNKNPS